MCFQMRNNEVLVAPRDIEVYKVLSYKYDKKTKEKIFVSAQYNPKFRYKLGETYHEPHFGAKLYPSSDGSIYYWRSEKGFYSWEDVDYARKYHRKKKFYGSHFVVAKFIIPKGSRYIMSRCRLSTSIYDDSCTIVRCSDAIRFVAWLSPDLKWITTPKLREKNVHTD